MLHKDREGIIAGVGRSERGNVGLEKRQLLRGLVGGPGGSALGHRRRLAGPVARSDVAACDLALGWRVFLNLRSSEWIALLVIAWGGSALATLLFTAAFAFGNPTVVILLQKTQPLFAIILAHILLQERLRWVYWPCFVVAVLGAYLISFDGFVEPLEALGSTQARAAALTLGAAILWGSSTALGRFILKDVPFHTLTGARLLLALPVLWVIVLAQGSLGQVGAGFAAEPARVALLALIPGLLGLLLYYRGLSGTKASYATLAEISFPASAVILNWVFLGVGVSANQLLGFGLLWAAILALGYLNARDPLPAPPVGGLGAERTG